MGFGIELANPQVEFLEKYKIIKKREINRDKVCLISGGGSGHEPAHAGYVGHGMLDAAVCGDVFASLLRFRSTRPSGRPPVTGHAADHQKLQRRHDEL